MRRVLHLLRCNRALTVLFTATVLASTLLSVSAAAQEPTAVQMTSNSLTELSLEDLMNITVTSVSKKPEKLWKTASAIYVITGEDIRRMGATSIPEALRGAPGVEVARINSSTWSVGTRGFTGEFASNLLVLVDGVSVYDPSFSGVYWMTRQMIMEDIDRIEIVRGPGGTMWGANAVNGVINIITKKAEDTQGLMASTLIGTTDGNINNLRIGGQLGTKSHYRVYGLYEDHADLVNSLGNGIGDDWQTWHSGFRVDTKQSSRSSFTFLGDISSVRANNVTSALTPSGKTIDHPLFSNASLMGRWNYTHGDGTDDMLQFYYVGVDWTKYGGHQKTNTYDLDFQRHIARSSIHDIVWGLGYRLVTSNTTPGNLFAIVSQRKENVNLFSAFLQDEITLAPDKLHLILGSKFERNDYTGFEPQPSGKIIWTPDTHHTLWASVSRAVRTPAIIEHGIPINLPPIIGGAFPIVPVMAGNNDLVATDLLAYELGYRIQPTHNLSFDLTAFSNHYANGLNQTPTGAPFVSMTPVPHIVLPEMWVNGYNADTNGVEISSDWEISNKWRLKASYSTFNRESVDIVPPYRRVGHDNDPTYQAYVRSSWDIGSRLDFDAMMMRVSSIAKGTIPAYTRVDLTLNWRRTPEQQLTLAVQNLTDTRHQEMAQYFNSSEEIQRGIYLKMTWAN